MTPFDKIQFFKGKKESLSAFFSRVNDSFFLKNNFFSSSFEIFSPEKGFSSEIDLVLVLFPKKNDENSFRPYFYLFGGKICVDFSSADSSRCIPISFVFPRKNFFSFSSLEAL